MHTLFLRVELTSSKVACVSESAASSSIFVLLRSAVNSPTFKDICKEKMSLLRLHSLKCYEISARVNNQRYLPVTLENRKLRWEKQMVCAIFFFGRRGGKLKKIWAVIWGDVICLLFLVCSANLDIPWSGSFFSRVRFYSFMFMHKICTRMVYANGKHPKFHVLGNVQIIFSANLIF